MDAHENRFSRIENKLDGLEQWKHKMDTQSALTERQFQYLDSRFDEIDKKMEVNKKDNDEKLDKINANFSRITWLIITAIVGAFMTWVLRGGLISP